MVAHKVHFFLALHLTTINGHVPGRAFNESTGTDRLHCDTCGWIGRSYKGRWRDKADETWREHAGDIAMGVEIKHGELNERCHCGECSLARRIAALVERVERSLDDYDRLTTSTEETDRE